MLDPKGFIAASEKSLLLDATLLMLIVVLPVIVLSFVFAWRYRAGNNKAPYSPNWSHSTAIEAVMWGIPTVIIGILAVIAWITSHRLDPYRPLASQQKPLTVQVIALNWKWLFIYPEQHVATINWLEIPIHRPVRLLVTADAPMNALQIPRLAGQIYAMSGMQTKLHFNANEPGQYRGFSANISGEGFSGMHFTVNAVPGRQFDRWVHQAQQAQQPLTAALYQTLAKPSENAPVQMFSHAPATLFNDVIRQYMLPTGRNHA